MDSCRYWKIVGVSGFISLIAVIVFEFINPAMPSSSFREWLIAQTLLMAMFGLPLTFVLAAGTIYAYEFLENIRSL